MKIEDIPFMNGIYKGVSERLILEKENELNVNFPSSYRKFLLLMGDYATFLAGESCFISDINDVQVGFKNTFRKHVNQYELSSEDFAFSSSQGTSYLFFKLNEGDDPPVYFYIEGYSLDKPIKLTDYFSDYLVRRYKRDVELYAPFYNSIANDC